MTDTAMLDWLDREGIIHFSYDTASITFVVPDALPDKFEGCNTVRELIEAAMNKEDE